MLENPTVYVDVDDSIEDLPSNVNVVYRTHSIDFDEDGNPIARDDYSVESAEYSDALFTDDEQNDLSLRPPSIVPGSITSTPHELADGSIVADISFSVEEVPGATYYEVRYTL